MERLGFSALGLHTHFTHFQQTHSVSTARIFADRVEMSLNIIRGKCDETTLRFIAVG